MPKSANELYRLLRSQKHGIPQFTPEPNENLPVDYRNVGVSIGDVGIWSEDSFEVLFNTCSPATSSINAVQGVPQDFVPFPLQNSDVSRRLYHSPGSVIASAKVTQIALDAEASSMVTPCALSYTMQPDRYSLVFFRFFPATVGSSVTFQLQSKECAMLVLPEGASREKLLPVETFRAYVNKNCQKWYQFAEARLNSSGSLFVVTGCDKTASWGIATASTSSGAISITLKFTVVGVAEGSLRPRYEWREFGSATIRHSRDCGSPRTENQCIFIRGFLVPRRTPICAFISDMFLSLRLRRARPDGRRSLVGPTDTKSEIDLTEGPRVASDPTCKCARPEPNEVDASSAESIQAFMFSFVTIICTICCLRVVFSGLHTEHGIDVSEVEI
jgi:hypothetical protein